jgi:hypothetical protein
MIVILFLIALFVLRLFNVAELYTIQLNQYQICLIFLLVVFYFCKPSSWSLSLVPFTWKRKYFVFYKRYVIPYLYKVFRSFYTRSLLFRKVSYFVLAFQYFRVVVLLCSTTRFYRFLIELPNVIPTSFFLFFLFSMFVWGQFPYYVFILNTLYSSLSSLLSTIAHFLEKEQPDLALQCFSSIIRLVDQDNKRFF